MFEYVLLGGCNRGNIHDSPLRAATASGRWQHRVHSRVVVHPRGSSEETLQNWHLGIRPLSVATKQVAPVPRHLGKPSNRRLTRFREPTPEEVVSKRQTLDRSTLVIGYASRCLSLACGKVQFLRSLDPSQDEGQKCIAGRDRGHHDVELKQACKVGGKAIIGDGSRDASDLHLERGCQRVGLLHDLARRCVRSYRSEPHAVEDDDLAGFRGSRPDAKDRAGRQCVGAAREERNYVLNSCDLERPWREQAELVAALN
jgi:hypothetical protein